MLRSVQNSRSNMTAAMRKPMVDYRREYKVPIHGSYAEVVRPGLIKQGWREGNRRG